MNYNKLIGSVMSVTLLGSTLAPGLAFARNDLEKQPVKMPKEQRTDANKNAQFCVNLTKLANKIDERLGEKEIKFTENKQKELEKLHNKRAENDARATEKRAENDQRELQRFATLIGKTQNDAQKAALSAFQSSTLAAVKARRDAFEAAKLQYRIGVNAIALQRTSTLANALATYKTAVTAAKNKAVADCAANVDAKTVKANLEAALKAAEKAFQAARQSVEKKGAALKPLLETRKAAMKQAMDTFHAALNKAKIELKTSLKAIKAATSTPTTSSSTP